MSFKVLIGLIISLVVVCNGETHTLRRMVRGQVKAMDDVKEPALLQQVDEPQPQTPADASPTGDVSAIFPVNQRISEAKASEMAAVAPGNSGVADQANKIIAAMLRQAKVQAQLLVEEARKKIALEEKNWVVPFKAPGQKAGQPGVAPPITIQTPSGPRQIPAPTEPEIQRVVEQRKAQGLPPLPREEIIRMIIETIKAEQLAPPILEKEKGQVIVGYDSAGTPIYGPKKPTQRPVPDEVSGPGDIVLQDGKGVAAPPIDTDLLTVIPETGNVTAPDSVMVNNTAPPDVPPPKKEMDIDAPLPLKTVGPIAEGLVDANYIKYMSVYTPKSLELDDEIVAKAENAIPEATEALVPIREQLKQSCLGAPCGDEVEDKMKTDPRYSSLPDLPPKF